jgi:hypothetical protein
MSKDIREMIDKVKNFKQFVNESVGKNKIIAYHASPHFFDKFSTEFMGSGEGAQAYGWGLYFTDDENVINYYLNTILPIKAPKMVYLIALKRLIELSSSSKFGSGGNRKKIDKEKLEYYLNNSSGKNVIGNNEIISWLKETSNNIDLQKLITYKYTVSINCSNFIDWNDKLTQVNYNLLLNNIGNNTLNINYDDAFRVIYKNISNEIGKKRTSLLLNDIGICGIQYSTKNNKNNYVVFDENNIEIMSVDSF